MNGQFKHIKLSHCLDPQTIDALITLATTFLKGHFYTTCEEKFRNDHFHKKILPWMPMVLRSVEWMGCSNSWEGSGELLNWCTTASLPPHHSSIVATTFMLHFMVHFDEFYVRWGLVRLLLARRLISYVTLYTQLLCCLMFTKGIYYRNLV